MIFGLLLLLLLIPIFTAPLETVRWAQRQPSHPLQNTTRKESIGPPPRLQIVYFTGVAGYSGDFLARREEAVLHKLHEKIPGSVIHRDIFPYSVSNNPLNGERLFRRLWEWLHKWRLKIPNNVFDVLIVVRNIGQLLVSADPRYGPNYNQGLRDVLVQRLDPTVPTLFLAYSGGAQMAVGAASQLSEFFLHKPCLVALGGVFTDDPAIREFQRVVQLRGKRDHWVPDVGKLLFPGLWRWQFWSTWNRYRKSGRFKIVRRTAHCHVGSSDYFGFAEWKDGVSYQDETVALIAEQARDYLSSFR